MNLSQCHRQSPDSHRGGVPLHPIKLPSRSDRQLKQTADSITGSERRSACSDEEDRRSGGASDTSVSSCVSCEFQDCQNRTEYSSRFVEDVSTGLVHPVGTRSDDTPVYSRKYGLMQFQKTSLSLNEFLSQSI
ncbi:hypothetical protein MRX96_000287 [Rhipicephalus microplus]